MIRLIASDLDGTLLDANGALPNGTFDRILRLKERGVVFCAASGRQYGNLKRLFAPVWRDMAFICENGTVIAMGDQILHIEYLPSQMAGEIIDDIIMAGMELLICSPDTCYLLPPKRWFTDDMIYRLRNTVTMIDDPTPYLATINKLSGYHGTDMALLSRPLQQKWGKRLHVDLAGKQWLDFTMADKGVGIDALSKALDIPVLDMAAFGDNFNDQSMLKKVGHPFLMRAADERLRDARITLCDDVLLSIDALMS